MKHNTDRIKILIIKLGYSETLDPEIGKVVSLGDVIRTTPILWALKEKYPDSHITWVISEQAEPLLYRNPFVDRPLVWDHFVPFQLMKEKFDILINLEKIPGVCALADMIDAWGKYGFRFETIGGTYHGYEKGLSFISYIEGKTSIQARGYWQQVLIQMLGVRWKKQKYILGYKAKQGTIADIGFNYEVGSKWPHKAMSMELWKQLEQRLIAQGFTISWQEGKNNLFKYMDWINSCRLIITNDSLGLHLAFALNKKVVGLFGPTDPDEVYFYNGSQVITSDQECPHMPCCATTCKSGLHCMKSLDGVKIENAVSALFGRKSEDNTILRTGTE
jgi:heptosyltransferase-2